MNKIVKYIIFVILISGCSKEKTQVIPDEFRSYVDMFFVEGNQRGLNINLDELDLIIQFGTLSGTTAGQCSFQSNTVTIDQNKWDSMTEEKKVWLIFHELGHCILDRQHKNDITENGECISIMKGIENNFDCSLNYYSDKWWIYYLDELFEPNTQIPNWYTEYEDYNSVLSIATILEIDTIQNYFELNSLDFSLYPNFRIDFQFNNFGTNVPFVKFYLGNIGFSNCDVCTGPNIKISSDLPNNVYFSSPDGSIQFNSDIKFSIRKIGSNLYFYVNERFIHTFEASLWSGNNISTIQMSQPIELNLSIKELE
jgi:hypothetical protein